MFEFWRHHCTTSSIAIRVTRLDSQTHFTRYKRCGYFGINPNWSVMIVNAGMINHPSCLHATACLCVCLCFSVIFILSGSVCGLHPLIRVESWVVLVHPAEEFGPRGDFTMIIMISFMYVCMYVCRSTCYHGKLIL